MPISRAPKTPDEEKIYSILNQVDELARQRRIDRAQGWFHDDVAEDLQSRQTEGCPRLHLPLLNGFDAGADDVGRIGADIDGKRHPRRDFRRRR